MRGMSPEVYRYIVCKGRHTYIVDAHPGNEPAVVGALVTQALDDRMNLNLTDVVEFCRRLGAGNRSSSAARGIGGPE